MAVLSRVSFSSQQRLDLQHVIAEQSFQAADFRYLLSMFNGLDKNYVVRGLEIGSTSSLAVNVTVANAMIMAPLDGATSFYVGLPDDAPLSILLPQNTTVFVEAYFERTSDHPVTTAQWDPGAITSQNPDGTEFTSSVNFEEYVNLHLRYNTGGFTESAIKIAKVKTDAASVTNIVDARESFYRLATGGSSPDLSYRYPWSTSRGEATGDSPSALGQSTVDNPYYSQDQIGACNDKAITSLKQWMDAMMTALAEVKGTPYWYSTVSQFVGKILFFDSINGSSCVPKAGLTLGWEPTTRTVSTVGDDPMSWAFNAGRLMWNLGGTFVAGTRQYDNPLIDLDLPAAPSDMVLALQMERETLPATANDASVKWFMQGLGAYNQSQSVAGSTNDFTGVAVGDYIRKYTDSYFKYIKVIGLFDGTTMDFTDGAIAGSGITGLYVEEVLGVTASEEKYRWFRANYSQDDLFYTHTDPTFFSNGSLLLAGDTPDMYFMGRRKGESFDWRTDLLPGREDMLVGLNNTGGTLIRGTTVTLNALGEFVIGSAIDVASCEGTVGVVYLDIPDGAYGYAQTAGVTFVLTTVDLTPGGETYLSPSVPGYTQPTPAMTTGQADFSMGPAVSADHILLRPCLRGAIGNVYEEPVLVVSGVAANDNEIAGPVVIDTQITLPLDSRNFDTARIYPYGSALLQVYLNGQILDNGNDYIEVGPGPTSTKIQIKIPLVVDDELTFRIDLTSTAYFSMASSGSSEVTNGVNLGTALNGEAVFASKVGSLLQFRRIQAGTGCTVTSSSTSLTIDVTGGGGSGEINTASNLGAGQGIFASKVIADLQFKSLIAGTGMSLTATSTGITLNTTGEANTAASVGAGTSIVGTKLGTALQFKSLVAGSGISLASDGTTVTLTATGSVGEANTASNLGAGAGVFSSKNLLDLRFKSIVAGTNISITNDTNTITINATGGVGGEANTASNLGVTGQGVFSSKSGVDLQFKKLIAGTNVTMSSDANSITINSSGSGEVNTASNLGAGSGIFSSKSGVDLRLKSLVAGTNVTLSSDTNTITINASGGGTGETNTASNVGVGTGIFASKSGVDLQFKSLVAGSGVSLTNDATTVTITSTGGGSGEGLYKRVITSGSNMATLYAYGLLADVNAITVTIGGNTADIGNVTGTAKLHSMMVIWANISSAASIISWPDPNGSSTLDGAFLPRAQQVDPSNVFKATAAGTFSYVSGTTMQLQTSNHVSGQKARMMLGW